MEAARKATAFDALHQHAQVSRSDQAIGQVPDRRKVEPGGLEVKDKFQASWFSHTLIRLRCKTRPDTTPLLCHARLCSPLGL